MVDKIKEFVLGKAKDPLDPRIFHNVSLTAFFAWVGLGADGLSSSCYGPEEAFLSLGHYTHLAIFLAIAVALTVFLLSACYSQIIELFPNGGGGYKVATQLLGPIPGLVSGSALLVDYVLTIAISVAASIDAIFSFFPPQYLAWKFVTIVVVLLLMVILNLRGVRESVLILSPIFVVFVLTHVFLIVTGIFSHGENLRPIMMDTIHETQMGIQEIGLLAMILIFLRAFSLGGGTFTGIEAISNGLQILREPRVSTAKKTMRYMAISLAFTAAGILVSYLLNGVSHVPGQTLNATLIHGLTDSWPFGLGKIFLFITLLSEGALLIVAAQTGFLDGPRVMSNMAVDRWLPGRFKNLSDRLVIKDGILVMGLSALAVLLYSRGSVKILVVMYSINVFLTFSLSQLGMVKHWLKVKSLGWKRKFAVNFMGLLVTTGILVVTATIKFTEGGWMTILITGGLIMLCWWVHRHYQDTGLLLKHLDKILTDIPIPQSNISPVTKPNEPTAVLMVTGYNGMGIHSLLGIFRLFPNHFKNFVFITVGVIDTDHFHTHTELEEMELAIQTDLNKYVDLVNRMGFYGESKMLLNTDVNEGLQTICMNVNQQWKRKMFFAGQLVFEKETMANRLLHNQTAFALQRKLLFKGLETVILPIRVRQ